MSLEAAVTTLTANVAELSELTKQLIALRSDAIERVVAASAPAGKAEKKGNGSAPAADPEQQQISTDPENRTDPAATAADDVSPEVKAAQDLVSEYMKMNDPDKAEREARRNAVQGLLAKVKANRVSACPPEKLNALRNSVRKLIEAGDINKKATAAASDGEELL